MKSSLQRTRWIALVLAALSAFGPAPAMAAFNAGAAHLQIPPGARAEGMGRFYNSVADDAFAPWWNPGGLAYTRGWNAGLMHTQLVQGLVSDVYFEYLGLSKYVPGFGGVAGTFTYLNYGTSQATDAGSTDPYDTFNPFEMSFSGAVGTTIIPNLGVGMNLKFILVDLTSGLSGGANNGQGTSFAVDLGGLYRWHKEVQHFLGSGPGQMTTRVGATVSNLGPDISLGNSKESDPLPRNLKIGSSWEMKIPGSYSILAGAAIEKSLIFSDIPPSCAQDSVAGCLPEQLSFWARNEILLSGGLELGVMDLLFGRVGYLYDDTGDIKNWTFGFGFRIKEFGLDYASIPQASDLDRVNKFSVVARF
jgi:type IX secretion system protein PorV